jgi:outer membrane protein assembly factor BamE (lipoprotein component of BamABCDE complex)
MDWRFFGFLVLVVAAALAGCDPQKISELEEGLSSEADVRARFGEPERVWDGPAGARIFEYNRQPAGAKNYMVTIGPDGRMSALRQVLTPQNFALVRPGMVVQEVRRMLGKPMKVTPYELQRQSHYDWRYQDGPNQSDMRVFTVVFDADLHVVSTQSADDPDVSRGNRR